jgi:hypothetical protein
VNELKAKKVDLFCIWILYLYEKSINNTYGVDDVVIICGRALRVQAFPEVM